MSFTKLGINHFYAQILEDHNIYEPTPIQQLAIPVALQGNNLIAEAQTGTGKTLAFILPTLQSIDLEDNFISALVIAPTRELAIQITEVTRMFYDVAVLNIYGGQDFTAQLKALEGHINIVVATPGRLLHHLRRENIDLSHIKSLVIDEADNMFKGGFLKEVETLMTHLPAKRQTLMFSATIDDTVSAFAERYLGTYDHVVAPKVKVVLDSIEQIVIMSSNRKKVNDLFELLKRDQPSKVIVFCRSRLGVDTLHSSLEEAGILAEKLHGGLNQTIRETVMADFREGAFKCLVTTDVSSRGLDISGVSHVINYNLPDQAEDYVHRIGRTGRAGFSGVAYTLLTGKDVQRLEKIEAYIGMPLKKYAL